MLQLLTALAVLLAGCYQDPDYAGTRFRCDTAHACPDGQECVAGVCSGAVHGGTDVGVLCGTTVCSADQQCCADFINGPRCTAQSAQCNGISATCDGIEDCAGKACCEGASALSIACGTATTCPIAQIEVCRDATDCTDPDTPACCLDATTPNEPWGRCLPGC